MKIFTENEVYVQKNDIAYLFETDIPIPAVIFNNIYITLNSELLGLFYHSYTKFNYKFLYHMGTVWIDSFTIDILSYTTITIKDNDFQIVSNKIRSKTIHKK